MVLDAARRELGDIGDELPIEIHERPPVLTPAATVAHSEQVKAEERAVYHVGPDENFSRSFLIGSARTMKLQTGLLAAFVVVLGMLVVQGVRTHNLAYNQAARQPAVVAKNAVQGPELQQHVLP